MSTSVVITGLGCVSSVGVGKCALYMGLQEKRRSHFGFREFSEAKHTPALPPLFSASIGEFNPESILGKKGLRSINRETKVLLSAAVLAARDANIDVADIDSRHLGVMIATQFSGLGAYTDLVIDGLVYGADQIDPTLGPQTGFNAPASQLAIRINAQGPNLTLTTGAASFLDVLDYAADCIRSDQDLVLLAGGLDLLTYFVARSMLATSESSTRPPEPFDIARKGPVPGEAGVVFVLESRARARARGVSILAEVNAAGSAYDADGGRCEIAAAAAFRQALERAGLQAADVGAVMASAAGDRELDAQEARALHEVLGGQVPVHAVKGTVGECYGASGALQVAAGLCSLETGYVPGTAGLANKDPAIPLLMVSPNAAPCSRNKILITALDRGGYASALVIGKSADD